MLLNETKSLQSKHAGKHKSQAINTDNGSALMNFNTVDDCRRELTAANNTIELLRSQLHDKERIIQLLEMQLQK
ncbi:hypothetical protein BXP70_19065 [Hymenobacter crusticola]|uniref:Uncharacterized protein n=2 Tax=Hymenobacter crusticola TaxID=1770526 RepID=A0A243W9Y8_9BACT|nr:hypothetical protein BXP70_19065 [Hymenobacter crusticola]